MSSSDDIQLEATSFRSGYKSLLLSTVNSDGFPEISYAPYIEDENRFYIFISGLAAHTKNLLGTNTTSVMFIEDESQADHAFSRKRLTYHCSVSVIPRDVDRFGKLLDRFQDQFGKLIQTLRDLADFQLFELVPNDGRYVAGFGKTYVVEQPGSQYRQLTEADLKK